MAFSFGNTSTPQKPTGFASPFGSTQPTTTQTTSFGFGQTQPAPSFGSTFGTAPTTAPPAFGATNTFGTTNAGFGATNTGFGATNTSFGATNTGFGTTNTGFGGSTFGTPAGGTAAPAFGSSFGNTQGSTFGNTQTQATTGMFGQQPAKPAGGLFGATTTSTASLFGGQPTPSLFGASNQTQAAPNLFGGNTTTPSLFGQTAAPSTTSSLFGTSFGQPAASTAPSFGGSGGLFGTAPQSTAPSLFGASTFGPTTAASGFSSFGAAGTTTTGFGGFGAAPSTSMFGAKPAQPAQLATSQNKSPQVIASVYSINVYNDERDEILKKWNMLQACWGTGKGYYHPSQPPIEYNTTNPFYRFKGIGYNAIPEQDNSEGIVKLVFLKKVADMKNQKEVLKNGIGGILGNRPNLTVEVLSIRAVSDTQTEVKICVSEKGVTGTSKKILATELSTFLNQPTQKQQLVAVGVLLTTPFVTPTKAELQEYLKNPPPGLEPQMWQAAIQDNPDPAKYIPVPINGFSDLRARILNQEYQNGLHLAYAEKAHADVVDLQTKHSRSVAQSAELKQKFLELQHRVLRVLVKQECSRNVGIAIRPEEEQMRGRLELIYQALNMPNQFKGQLNELLSKIKLIESSAIIDCQYNLVPETKDDIKQFLHMQQNAIAQLINIVASDLQSLQIITKGLKEMKEGQSLTS
ncbi:unnamed protein product [Ceutorhynchus assimilis]|uniref:Nucleoporin 54 n=1 Tax=Ceutorhynchus assimilis TaxID=467358 RepID=A0A9N9QK78_9CUCU|nr:unnamed protein product [Ceutorhynchus assimilis]